MQNEAAEVTRRTVPDPPQSTTAFRQLHVAKSSHLPSSLELGTLRAQLFFIHIARFHVRQSVRDLVPKKNVDLCNLHAVSQRRLSRGLHADCGRGRLRRRRKLVLQTLGGSRSFVVFCAMWSSKTCHFTTMTSSTSSSMNCTSWLLKKLILDLLLLHATTAPPLFHGEIAPRLHMSACPKVGATRTFALARKPDRSAHLCARWPKPRCT